MLTKNERQMKKYPIFQQMRAIWLALGLLGTESGSGFGDRPFALLR